MSNNRQAIPLLALLVLSGCAFSLPANSDPQFAPKPLSIPAVKELPIIPPGPALNQSIYSVSGLQRRLDKDKLGLLKATTTQEKLKLLDDSASQQYTLCHYPETLAVCDQMLALDAKSKDAYYWRSLAYLRQNNFDCALDALKGARVAAGKEVYVSLEKGIKHQKYDYEHRITDVSKRWALACTAILFSANKNGLNTIDGCDPASNHIAVQNRAIREWWDTHNRAELLALLRHLVDGIHNKTWLEMRLRSSNAWPIGPNPVDAIKPLKERRRLQLIKRYGDEFGNRGIAAWDLCRYMCLCRWGAELGWLTEDEAWSLMMPVAAKIQGTYSGWEQMAGEYLVGRDFWSPELYDKDWDKNAVNIAWLLKSQASPWVQLPWHTDLKCRGDDATIYAALDKVNGQTAIDSSQKQ